MPDDITLSDLIQTLRRRLIDLSNRNRLTNFRHSERARTHIRIVDELPDVILEKLTSSSVLEFKALPDPDDEPLDEQTAEFHRATEEARLTDEDYLRLASVIDNGSEHIDEQDRIERQLKDRVRQSLNLPPRPDTDSASPKEHAEFVGIDPNYELPEPVGDGQAAKHHHDDDLQTLLFQDRMDAKLAGIYDRYRLSLQEMGVNTLYVCFGFLGWAESRDSQRQMLAPLLLMPVEMTKKKSRGRYRYTLSRADDDPTINLALKVRLRSDFGMELPEFTESDSAESYLAAVCSLIGDSHPSWRVHRFVTIGHFAFAKLALYHDLGSSRWRELGRPVDEHGVVKQLLLGTDASERLTADDYDIDQVATSRILPLTIADADSSQLSAVIDAVDGKNLVIKGPPGTGKSQTITNIIAALMAKNRSVLFVAEKNAALQVVKKRLDETGLGDFCLELHSTRSNKTAVVKSLERRLLLMANLADQASYSDQVERLRLTRDKLSLYYHELTAKPFACGLSVFEVLWLTQARASVDSQEASLWRLSVPDVGTITALNIEDTTDLLDHWTESDRIVMAELETEADHPWHGVVSTTDTLFSAEQIKGWASDALLLTSSFASHLKHEEPALLVGDPSLRDLSGFAESAARLPAALTQQAQAAVERLQSDADLDTLARLEKTWCRLVTVASRITSVYESVDSALDAAEQIGSFTAELQGLRGRPELLSAHLADLPERSARINTEIDVLSRCVLFYEAARRLTGLDAVPTVGHMASILDAISLVENVPAKAIRRRSRQLFARDARDAVSVARERADGLKLQRKRLSRALTLPSRPTDDDILNWRHALSVLKTAGPLSFMLPTHRAAKRLYRDLLLDSKASKSVEPSEQLQRLVEFSEAQKAFAEDSSLQDSLGSAFQGLETDFELVDSVIAYGESVRATFSAVEPFSASLRSYLLEGDSNSILELCNITNDTTVAEIHTFIKSSGLRQDTDLNSALDEAKQLATSLSALRRFACLPGVRLNATVAEVLELPNAISQYRSTTAELLSQTHAYDLLGVALGSPVDTSLVQEVTEYWTLATDARIPEDIQDRLTSNTAQVTLDQLRILCPQILESARNIGLHLSTAAQSVDIDPDSYFNTSWHDCCLPTITARTQQSLDGSELLRHWIRRNHLADRIDHSAAKPVFDRLQQQRRAERPDLRSSFEYVLFRSMARHTYNTSPTLRAYSGEELSHLRQKFRDLDRKILSLGQKFLTSKLARRSIKAGRGVGLKRDYTDLSLIQHEISKQKRYLPIRELVRRAGTALQQLKPCFMMSPLSVANYLEPGRLDFDVIIIDEASQVRPEDSLSAVIRGKQLVVVGDPMQLPPTSFFDRLDDTEEEYEEELGTESILDLGRSVFTPLRELRWHYRSRDDSLIAFSNRWFYDDNLIVFPNPDRNSNPGLPKGVLVHDRNFKGTYKGRVNPDEARLTAQAVQSFMQQFPDHSLGVVAMNQAQRDLIVTEVDRLALASTAMSTYLSKWEATIEPFFVKNLENVQGDERDAVFISTVYGPNPEGRVLQRFGPVNSQVGHRRLNVLFTRAKHQVRLFTSLRAEDIVVGPHSNHGVKALADYLGYAFTTRLERGYSSNASPNEFETFVRDALMERGYEVDTQIGVSGYYIDLAVKHPAYPHGYILGIECDGAAYHSSNSARDRDRLRQDVLEGLGWTIHRIWSTDWFGDNSRALERVIAKIERVADQHRAAEVDRVASPPNTADETPDLGETEDDAPREAVLDETLVSTASRDYQHSDREVLVVQVGDAVELEYLDCPGLTRTVTIAPSTAEPKRGQIGAGAPLARAILDAEVGDECEFYTGDTGRVVRICDISQPSHSRLDSSQPPSSTPAREPTQARLADYRPDHATASTTTAPGITELAPYSVWANRRLPDPRTASRTEISQGLLDIVRAEGPIIVSRLFGVYARAAGLQRLRKRVRSELNKTLSEMKRRNLIVAVDEIEVAGQQELVVRDPSQASVVLRTRGIRKLEEIPPFEISSLMKQIRLANVHISEEELYRKVLTIYELSRLTTGARDYLQLASSLSIR